MTAKPTLCQATLALLLTATAAAQSWPQYHGPSHDRTGQGAIELRQWPEKGPPAAWKVGLDRGFSSFCVAAGRAYTLVVRDRKETCVALDADSGQEKWARPLGIAKYDGGGDAGERGNEGGDGPRSTPSWADGRVYVFDAHLVLHCLNDKDGKRVWRKDLVAEHGGRNLQWQNAASPLVDGGAVFVAGGGKDESLLSFDAKSGQVLWKALDEKMTHATPVVAEIHGVRQVIFFVQSGLVSVKPASGEVLWRIEYPYNVSTAASPVVAGDVVYCSAGYGVGAGAFRIVKGEAGFSSELLWRQRSKLMNHWSTPVVKDGHLYGMFSFKKYGKGPLCCVELATGETKWSTDGFGPGNCIVIGGDVVALSDKGELVLVEAKPEEYVEIARADVLGGKCWSSPAFADGNLYLRSTTEGAMLRLGGKAETKEK